jgi:hypothetical protein
LGGAAQAVRRLVSDGCGDMATNLLRTQYSLPL